MKWFNHWMTLCERFDGLVVRERFLIFGSLVAGIYLVFDTLLMMPSTQDAARLTEDISALQKKTDQISAEKQIFDKVSSRDPDADIKREQLKLQGRLIQIESTLAELSLRLVPNDRLPEVLSGISELAEKVNLKSIQTLKPEIIDLSGNKTIKLKSIAKVAEAYVNGGGVDNDAEAVVEEKVYRHAIKIQLEGSYFEIVAFLAALESLEWRFYWEGIDYSVLNYPNASVNLELYTLSTAEGIFDD